MRQLMRLIRYALPRWWQILSSVVLMAAVGALDAFTRLAPFFTCEAVLVESASFFPIPNSVLTLVERGDLVVDSDFILSREMHAVHPLTEKYADFPMDLADACLVRMTEMLADPMLLTTDADFRIYRRHSRQTVPCLIPG